MNRSVLLMLVIPIVCGCYSTHGNRDYSTSSLMDLGFEKTDLEDTKSQNSALPPSVDELLKRETGLKFPAKLLVLSLGGQYNNLELAPAIEKRLRTDPRFTSVEVSTSQDVRGSGSGVELEKARLLAARYQAEYMLLGAFEINRYHRTYWIPASISFVTLGLVPVPVGGQERFCSTEMLVMHVPSGVLLSSVLGHGHSQGSNIWGGRSHDDTNRALDETALNIAIDDGVAQLKEKFEKLAAGAAPPSP